MNVFQRIGNALSRFMYGRNGVDQLGLCMIWMLLILNLIRAFLKSGLLGAILQIVSALLTICILYRFFSRNLYRRRAENTVFLNKVWLPVRNRFSSARHQVRDKDHKYFTCPRCRAVCRVPRGKGSIIITCPRCGNQIHGNS